ncbi:phosphoglucomutase (alpha-D-glucose-1,6-bisphosphate-dependent) [Pandoraea sputorum]|uniref:Phosphoglucomutase n=1 Tax=Pandoraea sputorum TaxID=93222 RepID=A0A5E5BA59_9BURK|nr:phosphoglucomutase (alpha-D-glucose-1,6-bisphosphate-dependent) [Pandoraea sputorum]VVE82544.1 Phosphoglucomutase [Pandoraea sputorum]
MNEPNQQTSDAPSVSPYAGKRLSADMLVNVSRLVTAYYCNTPDPGIAAQRVAFGTSGHRGSSFLTTFNEAHVLAICQAICRYRQRHDIAGPIFIGIDTHALSEPAFATAMTVFAGNGLDVMISAGGEYTPTPAVSHAILTYNRGRTTGFADGVVITPSHNPPDNGGIKYNPPHGGPAESAVTDWIETQANELLRSGPGTMPRISIEQAMRASTTHPYDFLNTYVDDLRNVIDMNLLHASGIHMGVDPLGGAGVHYWPAIANRYRLNLTITRTTVDPTFGFMTADWDGRIRMDPSSAFAMSGLIAQKGAFDVAFACDTDHDRHGIVTPSAGLLPPNHYFAATVEYLLEHRPEWRPEAAIGKTVVGSQLIDRLASKLGRRLYEVPVGFKWFAAGLLDGSLAVAGEESAGTCFLRRDGTVWTTDKDGLIPALLAGEMMARTGQDPGALYQTLTYALGSPVEARREAMATPAQQAALAALTADKVRSKRLAGEPINAILTQAPGNDAPIGGLKVVTDHGWFAARPSGTEPLYKIYGESFQGEHHLQQLLGEAQAIVDEALRDAVSPPVTASLPESPPEAGPS